MNTELHAASAGWHPDPTGRHDVRYWDGAEWTEHVHSKGQQGVDPLIAPTRADGRPAELARRDRQEEAAVEPFEAFPITTSEPTAAAPAPVVGEKERKIPLFGARKHARDLQSENDRLEALIDEYGLRDVSDLDALKRELQAAIDSAQAEVTAAHHRVVDSDREREAIAAEVVNLRDSVHLQEYGLFDYENPAESSVALATELESVRSEIKRSVREGTATAAAQNFTFNNSAAQGRKFVKDMSKLMLRSYNAEAENCIKTVRAGNLPSARQRLSTVVDQIERLGSLISLRITPTYHRLRLKELELASRHLQALAVEKELERARREDLREQRKAEQELAQEKERLEKERAHYQNARAALEAKGDVEGAARLTEKLANVERAITDVDYRAANIRAGYVYVISNIGSFGPDVIKIGLTRRLDPMDRVNELGDASVPFRFDVHAMFFADDAVTIETKLHQHFAERRLNKVNMRREYFRATPAEVLDALKQQHVEVLEYTLDPAAAEYRSSSATQVEKLVTGQVQ